MKNLKKIDCLKSEIEIKKPFSEDVLSALKEYFKVGTAYASNAIEGNSLTEGETKIVIEDGLTIAGKPLKDHLEAIGYSDSFDFIFDIKASGDITEEQILTIHHLFYHRIDDENAGKYRKKQVFISGTDYVPPPPNKLHKSMTNFISLLNEKCKNSHSVQAAMFAHKELAIIHPFVDGNGRVARLLMNLILIKNGYYPTYIPPVLRSEYIASIKKASETKDDTDFYEFISNRIYESMKEVSRLIQKSV